MRKLILSSVVFLSVLLLMFVSSCSAPADKWSCSKLHSEIQKAEQHIVNAAYHRAQFIITAEEYTERVKAFEDAITYYRGRLKYCKEPLEPPKDLNSTRADGKPINNEVNEEDKETANVSETGQIDGVWRSASSESIIDRIKVKKESGNSYNFTYVMIDGSSTTKKLTLDSKNEFQTYNKWGEYYKITDGKLGSYDREGFIETYTKLY